MSQPAESEEVVKLFVGVRLDDYATFFDHGWSRKVLADTEGTKLDRPTLDLCADWKSAANTLVLPWLLMQSPGNFYKGFAKENPSIGLKLAQALKERLVHEMSQSLSNMRRKELAQNIDRICREILEISACTPPEVQPEQVWTAYLKNNEFILSLWSAPRLCYSAVYYAYENFLRRCVIATRNNSPAEYRPKTGRLSGDLDAILGGSLGTDCLHDEDVETARLARNALAHNGGMVGAVFGNRQRHPTVSDGTVTPLASDVRDLYALLKDKVTKVVDRAKTLPVFQT